MTKSLTFLFPHAITCHHHRNVFKLQHGLGIRFRQITRTFGCHHFTIIRLSVINEVAFLLLYFIMNISQRLGPLTIDHVPDSTNNYTSRRPQRDVMPVAQANFLLYLKLLRRYVGIVVLTQMFPNLKLCAPRVIE